MKTAQLNGLIFRDQSISYFFRSNWPRGKVLGGSSVLSYMLYSRGNRHDYDRWSEEGNTGWSFDEVLPYFMKSEDNRNPYIASNTRYHSTKGYLTVQEPPYQTPLSTAFIQAGVEMGYDHLDVNAAKQTGFMLTQSTTRDGARCSTAKAFLRPIRNRKNLHISMDSHVLKIIIDADTKTATGVKFEREGILYTVSAGKEVILSAGAVNSPQILMLSGVGPADHLKQHGISVLADLRVGDNLQDHVSIPGLVFQMDKSFSHIDTRFQNLPALYDYFRNSSGPLTSIGGYEAIAFVNSKYANQVDDYPDIQFHFIAKTPVSDGGTSIRINSGIRDDVWDRYYKPLKWFDTWQVIPILLRPKSVGTIRLAFNNPYASPLIDPKYFSEDQDIKVLIEGIKIALALAQTEAIQKLGTRFYDEPFPGCEQYTLWTDSYWECFSRQFTGTNYNPVGTCKMGPSNDPTAVVDPELRVYGIKQLRVVDGSIIPRIPSGDINAPIIMIAEKAVDMIKDTWEK